MDVPLTGLNAIQQYGYSSKTKTSEGLERKSDVLTSHRCNVTQMVGKGKTKY